MPDLSENLQRVRDRLSRAEQRAAAAAGSVRLVAVTKGCAPDVVRQLHALGLRDFGENRAQEAVPKMSLGLEAARWHMIGHLQENKINKILPHVHLVQSVDSLQLGQALAKRARRADRNVRVLLEVKTSAEATKNGVAVTAAAEIYAALQELPELNVRGLMTLAPWQAAAPEIAACFRTLRRLYDSLQTHPSPPTVLSMGMSDDFEIAIQEGANMVRIGRALVSP